MRCFLRFSAVFALTATMVTHIEATHAQANRTFVSGHGADSGACSLTAPCRSFAYAVTQTANAGEITVLDGAGYGPVTITQSLTITNPGGAEAGVTMTNNNSAITINTAAAADVTLRGLTLEGGGTGYIGVSLTSALPLGSKSTLTILNCVIKDFGGGGGLLVGPTESGATGAAPILNVLIADSLFVKNSTGIAFTPAAGILLFPSIYRTSVDSSGEGYGIYQLLPNGGGTIETLLTDVHVDNNMSTGIEMTGGTLVMKNSTSEFNALGTSGDIQSAGPLYLLDGSVVGTLDNNNGSAFTDGTDIIFKINGAAPSKVTPQ